MSWSKNTTFWHILWVPKFYILAPHLTPHCHSLVARPVSLDSVTRLNETLLESAAAPLVVRTSGLVPHLRCLNIGNHQVPFFDFHDHFPSSNCINLRFLGAPPWIPGQTQWAQVDIDIFGGRVSVEDLRVGSPPGGRARSWGVPVRHGGSPNHGNSHGKTIGNP